MWKRKKFKLEHFLVNFLKQSFHPEWHLISFVRIDACFMMRCKPTFSATPHVFWPQLLCEMFLAQRTLLRFYLNEKVLAMWCSPHWMMQQIPGGSKWKEWKCDHSFLYYKNKILVYSWFWLKLLFFRKDVRLPVQLQRAMAAEAEAAREARAKVGFLLIQENPIKFHLKILLFEL